MISFLLLLIITETNDKDSSSTDTDKTIDVYSRVRLALGSLGVRPVNYKA